MKGLWGIQLVSKSLKIALHSVGNSRALFRLSAVGTDSITDKRILVVSHGESLKPQSDAWGAQGVSVRK